MGSDSQTIHNDDVVVHESLGPGRRFLTIGEVSALCGVKPHVLRYWEHEFALLRPMKRRGNRRYYDRADVLLIQKIRKLLYDEGFTIQGARQRLMEEDNGAAHPVSDNELTDAVAILSSLHADLEDLYGFLTEAITDGHRDQVPGHEERDETQGVETERRPYQSGRGAAW